MTCKDCIHEKICDHLIASGAPWKDGAFPAELFCDEFKHKSRFIELPCAVGDTVYYFCIMKDKRLFPFINKAKIKRIEITPKTIKFFYDDNKYFASTEFGKTVFLTKEEAEKALAERNEGKNV